MGNEGGILKGFRNLVFEDKIPVKSGIKPDGKNNKLTEKIGTVLVTNIPEDDATYITLSGAVLDRDTAYARFLKTVKSLETVILDDALRNSAAINVLKGNGVNIDDILKAINMHAGILEAEKNKFNGAVNEQIVNSVGSLEKKCESLESSIKHHEARIAESQAEIFKFGKERDSIKAEIAIQKGKIDVVVKQFSAAADIMAKKLETDSQKLKNLKV
jgi:predicted RNase H-like nuclease (RuvC/YqgF family)